MCMMGRQRKGQIRYLVGGPLHISETSVINEQIPEMAWIKQNKPEHSDVVQNIPMSLIIGVRDNDSYKNPPFYGTSKNLLKIIHITCIFEDIRAAMGAKTGSR